MALEYCYPLKKKEILNDAHPEYPLFAVTIHGSDDERVKLSKRLVCAVKHLPLRLGITYEKDTRKSLESGVTKDPTLLWDDQFLAVGLISAEELTEIFEKLLSLEK